MGEINLYKDKTECCGCGACMVECPCNAITMCEDELGALYPSINEDICIKCGKCVRSCRYKKFDDGSEPLNVYAAINTNTDLYKKSASGGAFSLIASKFLADGGLVVGSVEELNDDTIDCKHIMSEEYSELERMYGSKYVQSRSFETFDDIKMALKDGKKVLFSGTPCQVAAIKKIVSNDENLYTIDLICHGTPPVKLFQDFIRLLGKKLHSKITYFSFRDKAAGRNFKASVVTEKRKFNFSHGILSYYKLFLDGIIYRENCYSCPYARKERVSDITVGDFWGIEKFYPKDKIQDKFWSCILVNSLKGHELIKKYGDDFELIESDFEKVACMNEQLHSPYKRPEQRDLYIKEYIHNGYKGVEKCYTKNMGGTIKMFLKKQKQILDNYIK